MAEAGPSQAVVPAEPEVDLTIHPSGIVPQLQVRETCCLGCRRLLLPPRFCSGLQSCPLLITLPWSAIRELWCG